MYRRRAIAEMSWLRYCSGLGLGAACGGCRVWIYAIRVYECERKDLGEDKRLCMYGAARQAGAHVPC